MKRIQEIKDRFSGVVGSISLYADAVKFHFIDVDEDKIEGYKTFTASCGCCSEIEDYDGSLSYEVEYMDEDDFRDLIEQLENLAP
jgi:hypothetical protein